MGPSTDETVGIPVAPVAGVAVCWAGGSEKLKAEVVVGWVGAGENAESGVEADSVANRSMVGSEAGEASLLGLETNTRMSTKKPQNKISPAAIQRVRLLVVMPLFYTVSGTYGFTRA